MGREPATPVPLALPVGAAPRPPARSTIEPVAADRWQWRIGLTAEQKAKLDRLRALLGHTIAGGDLDAVFDRIG